MSFDKKFKEMARACDAVDRLREVKSSLEDEAKTRQQRYDLGMRLVLLFLIATIVVFAILRL
jgi:cytochrome b subunit of formate dehydrogenase